MAYATRDYYISGYLQGRSPAVPDADFLFWEKQAEWIVDSYTFGRIKANDSLLTDDVKDCTCELTELLYRADKASRVCLFCAAEPECNWSPEKKNMRIKA